MTHDSGVEPAQENPGLAQPDLQAHHDGWQQSDPKLFDASWRDDRPGGWDEAAFGRREVIHFDRAHPL